MHDILSMQTLITTLSSIVSCFQKSQNKHIEEDKTQIIQISKLLSKSKQISLCIPKQDMKEASGTRSTNFWAI